MTTKKFDANTATLIEINKKLKALASQKCRAKDAETAKKAAMQYQEIAAIKAERFPTKRSHSYQTYTDAEIKELDLDTTIKAVKSLQSLICVYPNRIKELAPIRDKFIAHRDHLKAVEQLKKLQQQLNQ